MEREEEDEEKKERKMKKRKKEEEEEGERKEGGGGGEERRMRAITTTTLGSFERGDLRCGWMPDSKNYHKDQKHNLAQRLHLQGHVPRTSELCTDAALDTDPSSQDNRVTSIVLSLAL